MRKPRTYLLIRIPMSFVFYDIQNTYSFLFSLKFNIQTQRSILILSIMLHLDDEFEFEERISNDVILHEIQIYQNYLDCIWIE